MSHLSSVMCYVSYDASHLSQLPTATHPPSATSPAGSPSQNPGTPRNVQTQIFVETIKQISCFFKILLYALPSEFSRFRLLQKPQLID